MDRFYLIQENWIYILCFMVMGLLFGFLTKREKNFFVSSSVGIWILGVYPIGGFVRILLLKLGDSAGAWNEKRELLSMLWSLFYGLIKENPGLNVFYGMGFLILIPILFYAEVLRSFCKGKLGLILEVIISVVFLYSGNWVELPMGVQYAGVVSVMVTIGIIFREGLGLEPGFFWNKFPWKSEGSGESVQVATTRDLTMDFAKGLAIILMIFDHVKMTGAFITSFHMPLFFLISGYFLKDAPLVETIRKKSKGILVPYLKYSIIVNIATCFYALYFQNQSVYEVKLLCLQMIKDMIAGKALYLLWFLVALYLASILYEICRKLLKNHSPGLWALTSVLAILGYEMSRWGWDVVWYADLALIGTFFIHGGREYKKLENLQGIKRFCVLVFAAVLWFFGIRNGGIVLGLRIYPYFPYCVIAALAGCIVVLECCKYFKKIGYMNNVVVYFGQHTLQVLCITNVIRKLVDWQRYCNGVSVLPQFILQMILVFFYLTMVVSVQQYRIRKK